MGSLMNQLPTISEMDQLIGYNERVEQVDDYGGITITLPSITPSIRAKVRYERTNEAEIERQEKFTQEIKVWIRCPQALEPSERYVVYWDSSYWDIYAVERTPRNRFYVMKCRLISR